jgi:hypothetical protein
MVKSRWSDQTQQGGGGGSGEDRVRELVTTKAMVQGSIGEQSGLDPLGIDPATLGYYTEGTRLDGRATIDYSLYGNEKGVLGITHADGSVGINPEAFADDAVLRAVVAHEDVHVGQIMSGNFWYNGSAGRNAALAVNEVQGYRQSVASILQSYADRPELAGYLDGQLEGLANNLEKLQGTPYFRQVTTWPYNYNLASSDQCPPTACYAK